MACKRHGIDERKAAVRLSRIRYRALAPDHSSGCRAGLNGYVETVPDAMLLGARSLFTGLADFCFDRDPFIKSGKLLFLRVDLVLQVSR